MGTRAIIIAQSNIDGKWYGEYQKWDGMPEEVGQPLLDSFKTQQDIDEWVAHSKGIIESRNDDEEDEGYTVFVVYDSLEDAEEDWWNCFYRWDGSQWIYGRPEFTLGERPLVDVMAEINAKGE